MRGGEREEERQRQREKKGKRLKNKKQGIYFEQFKQM